MPNATVRANTRTLPEATNRRAVLRGILAGGTAAAAALPASAVATVLAAGARASVGRPDAALFALQADIEVADRLKEASFDPFDTAEKAYLASRAPIQAAPEDLAFTNEEWFLIFKEKMAELNASPSPESAAYAAAHQAWEEGDARLRVQTGLTAAKDRMDEIDDDILALREQIIAMRATTFAGLKFKAKYAADHYPGEPDPDVMESIVDDILAMDAPLRDSGGDSSPAGLRNRLDAQREARS